jgi:hypothetical protein
MNEHSTAATLLSAGLLDHAAFTPNALLDRVFYPVDALHRDEVQALAWVGKLHDEPAGALVEVWPGSRPGRAIRVLMCRDGHTRIDTQVTTVVLAGVGSSILGTAALARDVANQLDEPVVGIVTGAGLESVLVDAWTGWYWYGVVNRLDNVLLAVGDAAGWLGPINESVLTLEYQVEGPGNPDATLTELLADGARICRLIGHSKGALRIEPVLIAMEETLRLRQGKQQTLRVGTLGAVIHLPPWVDACQIRGDLDWLGALNSVEPPRYFLPDRGHSLNPQFPGMAGISLARDVWGRFGPATAFA